MRRPDRRAVSIGAGAALLLALSAWALARPIAELPPTQLPHPEELDSLSRYLSVAAPAPRLDDYGAFVPARRIEPLPAPLPPVAEPVAEAPTPSWQLSAILIAGGRPVAVIDDQAVAPGGRLPDGSVVLAIETDHVLLRSPGGRQHRLTLRAG